MPSSIYPLSLTINPLLPGDPIPADGDIIIPPLVITPELVKPGGGGTLRLYFSLVHDADGEFSVIKNDELVGKLNADQDFVIKSNGYYRFDIDVEANDIIEFEFSEEIIAINELRVHLVLLGA